MVTAGVEKLCKTHDLVYLTIHNFSCWVKLSQDLLVWKFTWLVMKKEKWEFTWTEFSGQNYTGAWTQKSFQFLCTHFPRHIFICTSIRHENYIEFQKLQKLQKTKPHNTVPEILRWVLKMWLQINKLKFNIKCILYFLKKKLIYQTKFLRMCC